MRRHRNFVAHAARPGFTLVELLVVVAIIALLVGMLMPSLARAKQIARQVICMTNLSGIGRGLVLYENGNNGFVVPSYNMTGTAGGPDVPLDGWGPILDRDGMLPGARQAAGNMFYCPQTVDVEGMAAGQTGTDPNNPKGWMDWPNTRNGTSNIPVTIPARGFNRILRISYWINSDNPIGSVTSFTPDTFYTGSVGYGPSSNGLVMRLTQSAAFKSAGRLIVAADGVYAGKQGNARLGTKDSRIGYRHGGGMPSANVVFADGHVSPIDGDKFPRAPSSSLSPPITTADAQADNRGPATIYADPDRTLGP
jgi:prepilin-type N-terminal cleavage/methylation domain-containing protein/prepilin-type processing-associated H-X9-DG protein